eukprot:scaffold207916_cov32-Tisochrysis_lutea.AAC.2
MRRASQTHAEELAAVPRCLDARALHHSHPALIVQARALYIFPTKALAQDQLRALRALVNGSMGPLFGLRADTYDGDTPEHERRERRDEARVLLTNPDTLHASVLPHHKQWADVLCHLR